MYEQTFPKTINMLSLKGRNRNYLIFFPVCLNYKLLWFFCSLQAQGSQLSKSEKYG